MNKLKLINLISMGLFFLNTSCISIHEDQQLEEKLVDLAKLSISSGKVIKFRMDTISAIDWDSLMIIPPYSYLDRLSNKYDIDFNSLKKTGIQNSDQFCLIIFISNKRIKYYLKIEKRMLDLSGVENLKFIQKRYALFQLIGKKAFITSVP